MLLQGASLQAPCRVRSDAAPPPTLPASQALFQASRAPGRVLIGLGQTGSGKTGAFALPIIQALLEHHQPFFAYVLSPTRELAIQIGEQFEALGSAIGLRCSVGDYVSKLTGHKSEVCGLKWSYDNRQLASGGNDNIVDVFGINLTEAKF